MSDVNEKQGEALVAELGENTIFVKADVTNYDQQAALFDAVRTKWKRIDFGKQEPDRFSLGLC